MNNSAYKLLKNIHKDKIKLDSIPPKISKTFDEDIETLTKGNYIVPVELLLDCDGYTRYSRCKTTPLGIEYIETRRRIFYQTFIPYIITTLISLTALANSILQVWVLK